MLGLARIERRNLLLLRRRGFAGLATLGKPGFDLCRAFAEGADDLRQDALDLEQRVLARFDLVTQRADADSQFLPVDCTDSLLQLV